VRGCEGLFGTAPDMARRIKDCIRAETNLIASVGVAPNKFLAKLASDYGKPDGLVVVPAENVTDFLTPLPVGRVWGVGAKAEKRLHALGIRTIGQLAVLPEQAALDNFGEVGRHIWQLAHGQDDRQVIPDREAKSISTETTFAADIGDREVLRGWLLDLVDHLATRLRHQEVRARTIEVKIRSSDFRTITRSQALSEATSGTDALWQAALPLFEGSLSPDLLPVRLLGVGAIRLTREAAVQGDLFEAPLFQKQNALDQTIDTIRGAFGAESIRRGSLVDLSENPEGIGDCDEDGIGRG
jgi:DNA polymerase IV